MASKRQLFELLEEKQEPFLLNVYLQENGWCSSKRLKRLGSRGLLKRIGISFGFLRSMLSKLVHGKPFTKALYWDGKKIENGRLSVFSCCSGITLREFGGDHQWRCIEMEEDSNELSPVSVLQFPNNRFKEENQSSSTSSFDSPREMPEVPAFPHHGDTRAKVPAWQILRGDLSSLTKLCVSDMFEFKPEIREEVGVEIEAAILQEIVDETVVEFVANHHCT